GAEVLTEVTELENLNQALQTQNLPVKEVELRWIPNNTLEISDPDQARSILKLMDTLESLDDVQNVTANFEMVEELITANMT
ncbi:MAG: YebC/PmpR family DNA-binding transcriptional regulator, partial [Xenococcaceae cyanobacterium]